MHEAKRGGRFRLSKTRMPAARGATGRSRGRAEPRPHAVCRTSPALGPRAANPSGALAAGGTNDDMFSPKRPTHKPRPSHSTDWGGSCGKRSIAPSRPQPSQIRDMARRASSPRRLRKVAKTGAPRPSLRAVTTLEREAGAGHSPGLSADLPSRVGSPQELFPAPGGCFAPPTPT